MTQSALASPTFDLARKVALLTDPRTYPDSPSRIETVETHMSWVFLTPTYAYKLKKPARYGYLDFSTLAAREWNCREELRLNQALAPGVYYDVVPLALDDAGRVRIAGAGQTVEWLVKMRRLPATRMLDRLIRARRVEAADVERLAEILIAFYRAQPPVVMEAGVYRAQFADMIALNRAVLARAHYALPLELVAPPHDALARALVDMAATFDRRVVERRIIEGHGDLRPEHVCLEPRPVIFDRLEFKREFRQLDAVDELSYFAMECEYLGDACVGRLLLERYRALTGDRPTEPLRLFYSAHRACVRARLAVLHVDELPPGAGTVWRERTLAYLRLAHEYCRGL